MSLTNNKVNLSGGFTFQQIQNQAAAQNNSRAIQPVQNQRISTLLHKTFIFYPDPGKHSVMPIQFSFNEIDECLKELLATTNDTIIDLYLINETAEHVIADVEYASVELCYLIGNTSFELILGAFKKFIQEKVKKEVNIEANQSLSSFVDTDYFCFYRRREIRPAHNFKNYSVAHSFDFGSLKLTFIHSNQNHEFWPQAYFPKNEWFVSLVHNSFFQIQRGIKLRDHLYDEAISSLSSRRIIAKFAPNTNQLFYLVRRLTQGFEPMGKDKDILFKLALSTLKHCESFEKDYLDHIYGSYSFQSADRIVHSQQVKKTTRAPSPLGNIKTAIVKIFEKAFVAHPGFLNKLKSKLLKNPLSQKFEVLIAPIEACQTLQPSEKAKFVQSLKRLFKIAPKAKSAAEFSLKQMALGDSLKIKWQPVSSSLKTNEIGQAIDSLNLLSLLMHNPQNENRDKYIKAIAIAWLKKKPAPTSFTYFFLLIKDHPHLTQDLLSLAKGLHLIAWLYHPNKYRAFAFPFSENKNVPRNHIQIGNEYLYVENDPLQTIMQFFNSWTVLLNKFAGNKELEYLTHLPEDLNLRIPNDLSIANAGSLNLDASKFALVMMRIKTLIALPFFQEVLAIQYQDKLSLVAFYDFLLKIKNNEVSAEQVEEIEDLKMDAYLKKHLAEANLLRQQRDVHHINILLACQNSKIDESLLPGLSLICTGKKRWWISFYK